MFKTSLWGSSIGMCRYMKCYFWCGYELKSPRLTHACRRGIYRELGGYSSSGRNRPRVMRVRDHPIVDSAKHCQFKTKHRGRNIFYDVHLSPIYLRTKPSLSFENRLHLLLAITRGGQGDKRVLLDHTTLDRNGLRKFQWVVDNILLLMMKHTSEARPTHASMLKRTRDLGYDFLCWRSEGSRWLC